MLKTTFKYYNYASLEAKYKEIRSGSRFMHSIVYKIRLVSKIQADFKTTVPCMLVQYMLMF